MNDSDSQDDKNPFPSLGESGFNVPGEYDDDLFFEEAMSQSKTRISDPNRSFIGSIISKKRFKSAGLILLMVFCIFIGKSAYLQIIQGGEYRSLAEENRILHHTLPSQRGIIYDRNSTPLSQNTPTFNIIIPSNIIIDDEHQTELRTMANDLGVSLAEIIEKAETYKLQTDILFAKQIPYDKALAYMAMSSNDPWISVETNALREYVTDEVSSLSHIIGYTSVINEEEYEAIKNLGYRQFDHIGKQGLEKTYESLLHGTYGEELLEVDAFGNIERIISKIDPKNGQNLYTTLDIGLQSFIETDLQEKLLKSVATKASVIVMDPNTGEILSLISWPAYDANLFAEGIEQESYSNLINDEDQPLFPRAIAGEFPSGSTIKPVYAAAALIEGIITPYTTFMSTGGIWVSVWFFPDWRAGGHGLTDVYHAIADSVNTFFYYIGGGKDDFEGLGIERMMQYASLFGFGSQTGIDLPGEANGFLPSKQWKEETKGEQWYIGDTYHVAIGQGDLLVTPLQIAQSTAVFANGGSLITPHLNSELDVSQRTIIDSGTAKIVQDAMRQTVTAGSARSMQSAVVEVAGKTGTAQWSTDGIPHSWFTGFAPFEDPQIVVTVLIEEGGNDNIAVPLSLDIINYWFSAQN
ncbi:MAG: penicillin-binding protein 2 [Patescibacteria group bacterium]